MKKFIITSMMLLGTMSASAQFTVYQPVEVSSTTYTPVSMTLSYINTHTSYKNG